MLLILCWYWWLYWVYLVQSIYLNSLLLLPVWGMCYYYITVWLKYDIDWNSRVDTPSIWIIKQYSNDKKLFFAQLDTNINKNCGHAFSPRPQTNTQTLTHTNEIKILVFELNFYTNLLLYPRNIEWSLYLQFKHWI